MGGTLSIKVESCDEYNDKGWERLVLTFPCANIFQTETYFEYKFRIKRGVGKKYIIVTDQNKVVGIALVIFEQKSGVQRYISDNRGYAEIRYGPLIKPNVKNLDVLKAIQEELDRFCISHKISKSMIFPPPMSSITTVYPPKENDLEQYCTFLVNLERTEEEIFSKVSPSHRKYIRRGYRDLKLRTVENCTDPLLDELYEVHVEKVRRIGRNGGTVQIMPKDIFVETVDCFIRRGLGKYILSLYNNKVVAGDCTIGFGDFGVSWLSDSSRKLPKLKTAYVLRWEGIKWSKSQKYKYYDFAQVACKPVPNTPRYGVYIFKQRFGGEYYKVYNRLHEYKTILSSITKPGYKMLRKIKEKLKGKK